MAGGSLCFVGCWGSCSFTGGWRVGGFSRFVGLKGSSFLFGKGCGLELVVVCDDDDDDDDDDV